jgi:hypothetical protein
MCEVTAHTVRFCHALVMVLPRSACHRIASMSSVRLPRIAEARRPTLTHFGVHLPSALPPLSLLPAHDDLVDQALVRAFELPVAVHVGVGNTSCLAELLSHVPALLRQQHGMTWHCIATRHATIQGEAMRLYKVMSCESYKMTHGMALHGSKGAHII